jgi:general secretion pathway protein L
VPVADTSIARTGGLHALWSWWGGFARWWLAELRLAVPASWLDWAKGEATPRVLVRRDQDFVVCHLASAAGPLEGRFPPETFGTAALEAWLMECGLARENVFVGPVLGRELFFLRSLSVPKAALTALPKILEQEVLRRTPFDISEIWHAAVPPVSGDAPVLNMCHWIIRKDRAEAALAELGLGITDVDFLAAQDNAEIAPVISFGTTANEDPPWAVAAIRALFVMALASIVAGFVVFEWAQSSVALSVEASLEQVRQDTHGGGDALNPAARLFAIKAEVGILEIWDELSRILPDHTFLSETRIADGKVTVSGFSADAAHLVRVIDHSPLFSDAALATAITPDATEHKDRFSISFRVRGGPIERPAESPRSSAP